MLRMHAAGISCWSPLALCCICPVCCTVSFSFACVRPTYYFSSNSAVSYYMPQLSCPSSQSLVLLCFKINHCILPAPCIRAKIFHQYNLRGVPCNELCAPAGKKYQLQPWALESANVLSAKVLFIWICLGPGFCHPNYSRESAQILFKANFAYVCKLPFCVPMHPAVFSLKRSRYRNIYHSVVPLKLLLK